jgi:hypothetical protein
MKEFPRNEHVERTEMWLSLGPLRLEIKGLAEGKLDGTERQNDLIKLLARIALSEMEYQARTINTQLN